MTDDQTILFALFALVFAGLLWGRFRYDLVAFVALLAAVVLGVVPVESAFEGFGHHATVVVALVLVVSAGLVNAGVVAALTARLLDPERSLRNHIAAMGAVGAALSGFMNNVAALALLMPADVETARKAGRSPGRTLMPLSFATILGGMVTLIGTPPNIIIASHRDQALGAPFAMFDFAPVGLACALVGLAYLALGGWRLIPERAAAGAPPGSVELADYVAELGVPEGSDAIGQRLRDLTAAANKADVALAGLVRNGRRLFGAARGRELAEGDVMVVEGAPDAIETFRAAHRLTLGERREGTEDRTAGGLGLLEAVVPTDARIAGRSVIAVGLDWRQNATLVGISRRGRRIGKGLRRETIQPGDVLLILGPADRLPEIAGWLGVLPLAERGLAPRQEGQLWLAAGIFAGAVLAASIGLLALPVALGIVVAAYAATGIMPLRNLYDHVEWPVVVLLGSMIPLGDALHQAGGTALIAEGVLGLTEGAPPWVILGVLMAVTMTLSDVLNNTATTVVAAPVAVGMAERLEVSADPFLMAVAVAASCAFLTPIGHKNNTLILGPGGYAFGDYWRMGLPLEILVLAVGVPSILLFWPL